MLIRIITYCVVLAPLFVSLHSLLSSGYIRIPQHRALRISSDDNSLGAPHNRPVNGAYVSNGGVKVAFEADEISNPSNAVSDLIDKIDDCKGNCLFTSCIVNFTVHFITH